MKPDKNKLAELVKEKRIENGYTQTELAESTKLSLRSIQRIEKGEVWPRPYSLNSLSEVLDCSFQLESTILQNTSKYTFSRKIIISIGSLLIIPLLGIAYLLQAANFPETAFEMMIFWILIILAECVIQWIIWVKWAEKS